MKYTNRKGTLAVKDGIITRVIGDSKVELKELGAINTISKLKNLQPIFQIDAEFPELKARLDSAYDELKDNRELLLKRINLIAFQNRAKATIVMHDEEGYKFKYGVYIYYGIPSSTLSVIWKADGRIPTNRTYHSDYLDLDSRHRATQFEEVSDELISKVELEAIVSNIKMG